MRLGERERGGTRADHQSGLVGCQREALRLGGVRQVRTVWKGGQA
jgi:hypothetical protein